MRKLYFIVAMVATLLLAGPAFADEYGEGFSIDHNDCNGIANCYTYNDETTINRGGSGTGYGGDGGTGYGGQGGRGGSGGDGGFAAQGQQQGQIGINENENTAFGGTGFGGSAEQGQAQGIFGSGNSSSNSNLGRGNDFGGAGGRAHQGQGQGQIGINEQGQDQGQDQGQSQVGINDQGQDQSQAQVGIVRDGDVDVDSNDTVNVDASDNSTHKIDNDFPVNTAAPVFAGNCSQGVSAQTMGFGGSVASGNPVCDYIAVAGAYIAGGDRDNAFRVLEKAEKAADWRFFFAQVRMTVTLGLL